MCALPWHRVHTCMPDAEGAGPELPAVPRVGECGAEHRVDGRDVVTPKPPLGGGGAAVAASRGVEQVAATHTARVVARWPHQKGMKAKTMGDCPPRPATQHRMMSMGGCHGLSLSEIFRKNQWKT